MNCEPCTEHPLVAQTKIVTPEEIIETLSQHFNIKKDKIVGKPRYRHIVEARMIAAYILRKDRYLGLSLKQIGDLLGNRDHSTIMHSLHQIDNLISVMPEMKDKVRGAFMKVYGNLNYFRND